MSSHMAARIKDDFLESENRESFSMKEGKADVIFFGEEEIGLLDIVLLDEISNNNGAVNG